LNLRVAYRKVTGLYFDDTFYPQHNKCMPNQPYHLTFSTEFSPSQKPILDQKYTPFKFHKKALSLTIYDKHETVKESK